MRLSAGRNSRLPSRVFLRRGLDSRSNLLIGAAPADVSRHSLVDVRVVGLMIVLEQRRGRHYLAGLAVAALRYVEPNPCLLDWMKATVPETFDSCNLAPGCRTHRRYARPNRLAALINSTSPAKTYTASEL